MKLKHSTQSLFLAGALAFSGIAGSALADGGFLGVAVGPPTDALRSQLGIDEGFGLTVTALPDDLPAAAAGVETNDILLEIEGQRLINGHQLTILINRHDPGDEVELTLLRGGKEKTVKVELGERPADAPMPNQAHGFPVPMGNPLDPNNPNLDVQVHALGADGQQIDMAEIMKLLGGLFEGADIQALDANNQQFGAMLNDLMKGVADAQGNGGNGAHADAHGGAQSSVTVSGSNTQTNVVMDDGTHKIVVKGEDGKKHLSVWDADGNQVFDGPIDTDAQLAAVPEDIRAKIPNISANSIIIGGGDHNAADALRHGGVIIKDGRIVIRDAEEVEEDGEEVKEDELERPRRNRREQDEDAE